jgi:hypothetical protein
MMCDVCVLCCEGADVGCAQEEPENVTELNLIGAQAIPAFSSRPEFESLKQSDNFPIFLHQQQIASANLPWRENRPQRKGA